MIKFQIMRLRCQVLLDPSVGWSMWGRFSEETGSLKMRLEKQGRVRRTSVGTVCSRLWRWECVGCKWRCVHLPGVESALWGGGQLGLSISLNMPPTSLPSIAVGPTLCEFEETHWEQEFGSPADHGDERFISSHILNFCWKTSLNPLTEDRCLPEQISALT